MKTGNKIALFYTAITIGIISVVTVVFYFVATDFISRLYYSYLTEKAYATAQKHWEKDELDEEDYARIQQHYEETLPVAAEILLNADSITEAHAVLSRYLTDEKIASLYAGNVVRFHEGKELGAAVYYPDNEGNFIVLVVSSNQYGGDIQHRIGWLLLGMLVISAVLVYFVGRLYATRMVDRIDAAYQSEKSFISNASHELNNPLTAIQGECEISLLKERTPAEYQAALGRIASETKRIILLMKNLLFLSHGDKEILKNARETVLLADFLMQFVGNRVRFTTDHFAFAIEANPHLLKIAIGNILRSACRDAAERFCPDHYGHGDRYSGGGDHPCVPAFLSCLQHTGVRRAWYRTQSFHAYPEKLRGGNYDYVRGREGNDGGNRISVSFRLLRLDGWKEWLSL